MSRRFGASSVPISIQARVPPALWSIITILVMYIVKLEKPAIRRARGWRKFSGGLDVTLGTAVKA
jgi:hypothetical protein